jgi:hypothetical protein
MPLGGWRSAALGDWEGEEMIEVALLIALVVLIVRWLAWNIPAAEVYSARPIRASAQPSTPSYRTQDGMADYKFSFEKQLDGNWRAYILAQPSYGARLPDAHATHRLIDKRGRSYICWTGPLRTEFDAQRVAAVWADATQVYIKTGRFPDGEWVQTWKPRF